MKAHNRLCCMLAAVLTLLAALPCLPASAADTPVRGDVSGDGVTDIDDVYLLRDYLLAKPADVTAEADLDGSGSISAADLTLLKRMLLPQKQERAVLMIYLVGADLESELYEASNDIYELQQAEYGSDLTVVVQTGGTAQWHTAGMTDYGNDMLIFDSTGTRLRRSATDAHAMDGGFLQAFIADTAEEFPADHYGLILWGHGMGPLYGLCYDPLFRSRLTLPALRDALTGAGVHFDWVGFDTCLMANAETAYALRGCADYMIASEESVSGYGWHYTDFVTEWSKNPGMDTAALAGLIMEDIIAVNKENDLSATVSCFDLSCADEMMTALYGFMDDVYDSYLADGIGTVQQARASAADFGEGQYDITDLDSLLAAFPGDGADAVRAVMQRMITDNLCWMTENACGMSLWFFRNHPEDYKTVLTSALEPIGIRQTYLAQLTEMAQAACEAQQTAA